MSAIAAFCTTVFVYTNPSKCLFLVAEGGCQPALLPN